MSAENFPQMPAGNFAPPSGGDNANLNAPNMRNYGPGQEVSSSWAKAAVRGAKIRQATSTVIQTRSQFKKYLQQNGLDLWTSAVEFQRSGDFILSSYVVYPNHNSFREPLSDFLRRYPNLQPIAISIRDSLFAVKDKMQVISKSLLDPDL